MSPQDDPDAAGTRAEQQQPTSGDPKREAGGASTAEPGPAAATSKPDPAAGTDRGPVISEAGGDSTAAEQTLTGIVPYAWWFLIAAALELLFGGVALGTPEATGIHVDPPWVTLIYIAVGSYVGVLGFGVLRLERWAYWGAWLATLCLATLSAIEIVRWINGTAITYPTFFFSCLNALFFLFNVYLLIQPGTRKLLRFGPFRGSLFSPGMALCGLALFVPSLALTVFVNYVDKHIRNPTLLLIYLLAGVLLIVMGFCGVRRQRWVWVADLLWIAILTAVSLYVLVDQLGHATQSKGPSVNTQGLIASGIGLVIALMAVVVLFSDDLRGAVFRAREKHTLFSAPMLIGGLSLGVFATVIYLLPGELGTVAINDTVLGLAIGAVVGSLPGADVANRISAYYAGVLLAFASYVARGGLLPYTKGSSALVVLLMLVVITVITAVIRSRAWFVLMLLGVASMYGLAEGTFQAAPGTWLAAAGLAVVGPLMGFSLGFAVSSLLAIELLPYKPPALSSQSTVGSTAPSHEPAGDRPEPKAEAEAA